MYFYYVTIIWWWYHTIFCCGQQICTVARLEYLLNWNIFLVLSRKVSSSQEQLRSKVRWMVRFNKKRTSDNAKPRYCIKQPKPYHAGKLSKIPWCFSRYLIRFKGIFKEYFDRIHKEVAIYFYLNFTQN